MATIVVRSADEVGPALREARLADGLSQSALAEMASVSRQWLNAFELGDKPGAPLSMVMAVLRVLDTSVTLSPPHLPTGTHGTEPIDLDEFLGRFG